MLFNSVEFAIFFPLVFALYWGLLRQKLRLQNAFLLFVSYFFYGWWDWRFLLLIFFSSLLDYAVGIALSQTEQAARRKWLLAASLASNLGMLGFFKYYNFFAQSFADAFTLLGQPIPLNRLEIILPVGISFYTFQTLSYTIDVFRRQLTPTRDFVAFFAFVSFFPQLVAGPIERASHLLPQFFRPRHFDYNSAREGIMQIFWGLFKKVVIADNLAFFVDTVYGNPFDYRGFPLLWATLFFAVQIYCDFSGYSSMARGMARLLGFDLMVNFDRPYLATDIRSFWRRWHISLSTWFRDYVYIPLGGNRGSAWQRNGRVLLTFLVSGLWHGANWTFMVWGGLHGAFNMLAGTALLRKLPRAAGMGLTLTFVLLAWVFFRAANLSEAFYILRNMFAFDRQLLIGVAIITPFVFVQNLCWIVLLFGIEWLQEMRLKGRWAWRGQGGEGEITWAYTVLLILLIYLFGSFEKQEFIYFQF